MAADNNEPASASPVSASSTPAAAGGTTSAAAPPASSRVQPSSSNPTTNTKKAQQQPQSPPREYNPRWKGYSAILLSSLINFSAVSNIQEAPAGAALSFGVVLFVYALAVLFTDRVCNLDHYTRAADGKLEGGCLAAAALYAAAAVAFLTQVGGVAYLALNVYFTSWLMLAACLHTLNRYSGARDILTFQEMTSVSATLKSWYILFLASLVVTGTSIHMYVVLKEDRGASGSSDSNGNNFDFPWVAPQEPLQDSDSEAAAFGTAFGLASTVLSLGFILVHYNLLDCCTIVGGRGGGSCCVEGGWTELACIVLAILMWVAGAAYLTQDGGIAATIVGTGYRGPSAAEEETGSEIPWDGNDDGSTEHDDVVNSSFPLLQALQNATDDEAAAGECFLFIFNATVNCTDLLRSLPGIGEGEDVEMDAGGSSTTDFTIPGSNLYLAVWTCLLSSLNLANRWKAQQALRFAQAQRENAIQNHLRGGSESDDGDDEDEDEEDDDDMDDFEDADDY